MAEEISAYPLESCYFYLQSNILGLCTIAKYFANVMLKFYIFIAVATHKVIKSSNYFN